jgi:sporulation protein YlmC with PRC-barrel domain
MTRSAMAAALAAMLAATAPPAEAQTLAVATPFALPTGQLRASQLIGSPVYDLEARDIGSIKDVILDRDGRVAAVVLDVGTFLGQSSKYIGVPLIDVKTYKNRLLLDRTKQQLQVAPPYRL